MAADGDLVLLQQQLKLAISEEEFEKCAPLRDKIKQAQATLAAKRAAETAAGAQGKAEIVSELEAQLALAVKLCDFGLCMSLRDHIKFLKCATCGVVYEDALQCGQCGGQRPTPPDAGGLTGKAEPSTPIASPKAPSDRPTPDKKDQEQRPEYTHKVQPVPVNRDKAPQAARTIPSALPPASRLILEAPTRARPVQAPMLLSQTSNPNLFVRALPPQLDHSNQECEDQLWSLLGTLDADGNYAVARKYFADRGRGAFFLLFKDKQALFEATKATFQYHTQQGLTSHGVYGTDMAAALNNYDPQAQFIGCVLLKQLSEGQPLFLCQLFGEEKHDAPPVGPQGREAVEAKLEKKLQQRPTLEQIQKSTIRPSAEETKSTEEAKKTIWNTLTGFFRWRPKVGELERLNILTTPLCFGIPLAQVYARSNLGDGVLVPNIVRKLIGQLRKEDIAQLVGIFRINGNPSLTVELKRKFDFPEAQLVGPNDCTFCQTSFASPLELKLHGKDHEGELAIPGPNLSRADPHTLAGLLKMFLRELAEPLFPFDMYLAIYEAASASALEKVPSILAKLPPVNAATWNMILDFLVEVCFHQKTNMMPPRNVGIVIAPNILRLPPKLDTMARFARDTPHNVAVIEFLIENRAKELNMVPKGVPPPKPVISVNAAKNLLEMALPPLLPPVEVPTAEVQAPSPSPSPAPSPRPCDSRTVSPPRSTPLAPDVLGVTFPPQGRPGPSAPVKPPIAPPKPLGFVLPKLPKLEGSDSESGGLEGESRRLPGSSLEKSSSSTNLGQVGKSNPGYKTLPPARPTNPKATDGIPSGPFSYVAQVQPQDASVGAPRNVRPPMPPPR